MKVLTLKVEWRNYKDFILNDQNESTLKVGDPTKEFTLNLIGY